MSILCGWLGPLADADAQRQAIEKMAAAACRDTAIRYLIGSTSAIAVSSNGNADLGRSDNLLAALVGRPRWLDADLAQIARAEGPALALLTAYRRHKHDLFRYLSGEYALAVLCEDSREALLGIDRMGICPMAYTVTGEQLVFGSSTDAVRAHPAVTTTLNPQAVYEYLYFDMIPSPQTIYVEQQKLEPSQYVRYVDNRTCTALHWEPTFIDASPSGFRDTHGELLQQLLDAVNTCEPDPNTGAFLSGGLDSSTVAGVLARVTTDPVRTYSIGFDAPGYDEMHYAEIAARHFGLDAHSYYVTPDDVAKAMPLIAQSYDEPFGNSSSVAVYYCARFAREDGIKIMLAGDGGDEIFAGNERYATQKVFELYQRLPRMLRRFVLEPTLRHLPFAEHVRLLHKTRRYIEQANIPLPDRMQTYNWLHVTPPSEILKPDFLHAVDTQRPLREQREVYHRTQTGSSLNRMLYLDWKLTLADNDIRKVNRMCDAAGVEVRYPMLTDELVAYSTTIPSELKLKGYRLRHFYKESLKDFLPQEIISKSKHGFGLPFGVWLKTSKLLQEITYDALGSLKRRDYIRADYIDTLVRQHREGHAAFFGSTLWSLVMLELWLQAHAY
jgi:asparagine synthase (glutamine-hydrolysing)